ncbi:MAG TPA: class I SAM-dependent methyltransferase [Candidatus Acidoferrales bacterium]
MNQSANTISPQNLPAPVPNVAATLSGEDFWQQRLSQREGLEGVGYTGLGLPFNRWIYRLRKAIFVREVSRLRLGLETASVLDVGSGTGFWLGVWKSLRVKSVSGSDITNVAVQNLTARFADVTMYKLDIGSASTSPALARQYDIVSAMDMLYHIVPEQDYANAIANISNAIRPGGFFVFSENLVHRETPPHPHQVNRTLHTITRELLRNGLHIQRRVPMAFFMNKPVDTRSNFPQTAWRIAMAPVRRFAALGEIYGAVIFPIDWALTQILAEGPSTELVICQKQ